ncbi:Oidioi.mRNA.OKI2018_I69.chr1.g1240.t1.cds [Oikopleura dioica]|uniref:Oidioi.mRNA.OKI2018_I69.chr1.g1240.t1.cds n=1 Tax=Oikopleura dioica TaxID=34765 RepID=A0ABN7SMB2_OIKDI|nr:Oidioi.mRNA.OKI2018_I69.chr1.g1240.t1.cds [Oikopleura dioica]
MARHSRKFKNLGEQVAPENLKQFLEYTKEFIQALEKEPDAIRPLERLISYSPDSPIIISSDDDDSLRQMDIRGFMLPTSTPMKSWETLPNLTLTPINPEIKRDESTVQIRNRLDFDANSTIDSVENLQPKQPKSSLINAVPIINGEPSTKSRKRKNSESTDILPAKKSMTEQVDELMQKTLDKFSDSGLDYLSDADVTQFLSTLEKEEKIKEERSIEQELGNVSCFDEFLEFCNQA